MFGGKLFAKEPVEPVPDRWPAEIGEQMAAVHQMIYPVANSAADPRLVELLKLAEGLRAH